jgi:Protein of unknown function (DUF3631)
VWRCVGEGANQDVGEFMVFCPKVLAGIGNLPDTVADRSLPIRLERRTRDQKIERFRERDLQDETVELRDRLERFAIQHVDGLRAARPELPDELDDRGQDMAEPLLAIADLAGGDFPTEARRAIVELRGGVPVEDDQIGVRLVADIRAVLGDDDRITSKVLLDQLKDLDESPWPEWGKRGRGLSAKTLADLLRAFGIRSRSIKLKGGSSAKGFLSKQFEDAWTRYLPSDPSKTPPETSPRHKPHSRAKTDGFGAVTEGDRCRDEIGRKPASRAGCAGVTGEDAFSGAEHEGADEGGAEPLAEPSKQSKRSKRPESRGAGEHPEEGTQQEGVRAEGHAEDEAEVPSSIAEEYGEDAIPPGPW